MEFNDTLSFFTFRTLGVKRAFINMNNGITTVATRFPNVEPTTGSPSKHAYIQFDGTNKRFDFHRVDLDDTDVLVCRIDSTGRVNILVT